MEGSGTRRVSNTEPFNIRVPNYIRSLIRHEAQTFNLTETAVVNRVLLTYYTSQRYQIVDQPFSIPVSLQTIGSEDLRAFIQLHSLTHKEFAARMLVRAETVSKWLKEQKQINLIYQDRFKRVRKHYPDMPPI